MKVFLLIFLCVLMLITESAFSQGLWFKSTQQSQIADRTSYSVFAERVPLFKEKLNVSFELSILDPNSFGFICVVDAEKSNKDYSLSYVKGNENLSYLKLNLKGEENLLTVPVEASLLGKGQWIKVNLDFRTKEKQVHVTVNSEKFEVKESELNDLVNARIYFGKNENVIDIPSFAIRNLTVSNSRETYNFQFKEYAGNEVHDQHGNAIGWVENPFWLINDSYHWKPRFSYSVDQIVAVNYDTISQKILVAGSDSLILFDMQRNIIERHAFMNKLEVPLRLETSFFANGKFFVYEVNDVRPELPTIASLDLATLSWTNNSFSRLGQQLHHHNAFLDASNEHLLIFGGFGNNRLSKAFYSYDIANDLWNSVDFTGDEITPRFFSGMGKNDDQLLLFGGVGNKTGDQSIGKIYYYDCYAIDLNTRTIKKLWELDRGDKKMVSTRELVMADDQKSFYTLCYPEYIPQTYLKLYRYDIKNGNYSILGDSIPMISEEIQTNANLYLNNKTKELYCITQEVRRGNTNLKIYSIDNPPISAGDLYVNPTKKSGLGYWLLGGIIFLVLGGFFVFYFRKRKTNKVLPPVNAPNKVVRVQQARRNAVYIFGVFTVYNRDGQDCSYLFSPQVKHLFLLILLRSVSGEDGITSEEIYNLLWPGKPLKNAKNLKGVTVNKVRTILNDIDGIELLLDKQHFRFQVTDAFYCDYFDLKSLDLLVADKIDEYDHCRLVEITSRGAFLQSGDNELFDPHKRDFADHLLVLVPDILRYYYSLNEFSKVIDMAGVLYCVDDLNECAFYYIVSASLRLGDELLAKKYYNSYILRHRKMQGEDYNVLYPELVKIASKYVKKS